VPEEQLDAYLDRVLIGGRERLIEAIIARASLVKRL
jgi:hypothetical protein